MRTAVIFTGQERTLRQTIPFLRQNLLESNNAVVFLACESSNPDQLLRHFRGIEVGGSEILQTFRTPEFNAFIQMVWSSGRPALLQKVFNRTNEGWTIQYLWDSGTVIQYYQVWKAWLQILEYEKVHGMKFDVVVRCRPDCLLTEKLDLSKLTTTGDEFTCRSMGSERIYNTVCTRTPNGDYEDPVGHPYIEKVVWTLGFEQVWIAKRDVFALFGPMVFVYGCWDSGGLYAFNSESFFQEFCRANHITHWGYMDTNQTSLFNHSGSSEFVFSLLR